MSSMKSDGPVAYVVTHQPKDVRVSEGYLRNIRELHRRVAEEASQRNDALRKTVGEAIGREIQVTYGALTQFLVTPLKSDQLEVKKILEETMGRALDIQGSLSRAGYRESRLSRTVVSRSPVDSLQPLLDAGKEYYRSFGFHPEIGGIYESDFVLESATGLDFIEHIVRDRMGIYDGPHGRHIQEAGAWTFAAYNIVIEEATQSEAPRVLAELPLSKPASLRYDAFREGIGRLIEQLKELPGVLQIAVWQRKLGLGPGREFLLRIGCSDLDGAAKAGDRLSPLLRSTISTDDDSPSSSIMIIMKEILSPL